MRIFTHTRTNLPGMGPTLDRPVRLVARDLNAAEGLRAHTHAWGQVTYALEGILRVTVGRETWIVPPHRAIWIPNELEHEVVTVEKARLRVLFVAADRAPFPGRHCKVLDVSPLLRELILAMANVEIGSARESRLTALILDELSHLTTLPIVVALPHDKRLKALCEMLIEDPASNATLDKWAMEVGASGRTLARLFERELGMCFSQWRQQVRLAHAAPLIARGLPLKQVASELGYASQSAFTAMFRKTFGESPRTFFAKRKGSEEV